MNKVSYPLIGNYDIPAYYFLSHVFNVEIIKPKPITKSTVSIGCKYSPEFVCMPFKYTLGTMIESVEKGANVLIQLGGGCRYGYYGEVQQQILNDLGYDVKVINLVTSGKISIKRLIKEFRKIDKKFNMFKAIYYAFITLKMVKYMDDIDKYIRSNIGFEIEKGSFESEKFKMLNEFKKVSGYFELKKLYKHYKKEIKSIKVHKPDNLLKVGIIGELYTIMEPNANYFLEKELASNHIEIKRFTNAHYLLIEKKIKKIIKIAGVKYNMGADACDNIARTKWLIEHGYDGIIHIKSSFCTPEIGAIPIINNIANEKNMPIIFFSFDAGTSQEGIKTRLEAFYDMLEMRRNR